jgi:hypothetical protein
LKSKVLNDDSEVGFEEEDGIYGDDEGMADEGLLMVTMICVRFHFATTVQFVVRDCFLVPDEETSKP